MSSFKIECDNEDSFRAYLNGPRIASAVEDFEMWIRNKCKHVDLRGKDPGELMEEVRKTWYDLKNDRLNESL